MKNIDTAFQQMRLFCILFLIGCLSISLFTIYWSHRIVRQSQQKIFVISNGKAIEAYAADRKDNIEVEAKDHVGTFHHYFFSLDPGEKSDTSKYHKSTLSRRCLCPPAVQYAKRKQLLQQHHCR